MGKMNKKLLKKILIYSLSFFPFRKRASIFVPTFSRSYKGGPGRFLYNLENGLRKEGINVERFFLSKSSAALIITSSPGDFFFKLCKRKGIKTVLRVDGFYIPEVFDNKEHPYRMKRELTLEKIEINQRMQRDLVLSDWVVYQSHFCKKMADKYLYNRIENYSIIYNGVDIKHFRPMPELRNKKFTILCLGTWRDTDLMLCNLESFRLIRQNIEAYLYIVGPRTKNVEKVIKNFLYKYPGLKEDIILFDFVPYEKLPEVINKCHIALHLKAGDWCPNAVLEIMACGVPVICQEWGGTKELVGRTELIVHTDPFVYERGLALKVAEVLLYVKENMENYSVSARKQAELFSLDKMTKNYIKVLINEI